MNEPFRLSDLSDEQWQQGQELLALAERYERDRARRKRRVHPAILIWLGTIVCIHIGYALSQA